MVTFWKLLYPTVEENLIKKGKTFAVLNDAPMLITLNEVGGWAQMGTGRLEWYKRGMECHGGALPHYDCIV